MLSRRHI